MKNKILGRFEKKLLWLLSCIRYEDSLQDNVEYRRVGSPHYPPLSARPCTPRYLILRPPLRNPGPGNITLRSSSAFASIVVSNTVVATSSGSIQENILMPTR